MPVKERSKRPSVQLVDPPHSEWVPVAIWLTVIVLSFVVCPFIFMITGE